MRRSTTAIDVRVRVFITGRVQGVGFRYHTRSQAQSRNLTGWVRNLADGRVEAEFQGVADAVDAMLGWCQRGPAMATVIDIETQHCEVVEHDLVFSLRH